MDENGPGRWRYLNGLMRGGTSTARGRALRRKLADDETTLVYLGAGIRVINRTLTTPGAVARLFAQLKLDDVQKEASKMSLNALRHRWPEKDILFPDILAHSLHADQWGPYFDASEESRAALLEASDNLTAAVHKVAYNDIMAALATPSTRIGFIAAALADGEPVLEESLRQMYSEMTKHWSEYYEELFITKGLKLRPEINFLDLTYILTAISEGLQVRLLAGEDPRIIDHEQQTSLLGTAGLALLVACVDPGDGLSLEELLRVLG